MLVGREPAKMRPSKDLTTCGRSVLFRPGSSSVMASCPPGSGGSCPVGRRGVRDCSRAPLVTRLGGQAVRGQRNRTRYPYSDALSTSGGPVRPAPHPEGASGGSPGFVRRPDDASANASVGLPRRDLWIGDPLSVVPVPPRVLTGGEVVQRADLPRAVDVDDRDAERLRAR